MSTFKVSGVRTLVLPVTNVEASAAFYKDMLGFEEDYAADGMVSLRIGEKQEIAEASIVPDISNIGYDIAHILFAR